MREVIYSMGVSLDGYIEGPNGEGGWAAPDAELHRLHNEQTRERGVHLLGRRLYEVMRYRLFVSPVVLGGGKPFFAGQSAIDLELLETRTFSSRVVYLRYRRI